jgi:CRP-like cAMP-binding protein
MQLDQQSKLVQQLPASLRLEVNNFKQKQVTKQLTFLHQKSSKFKRALVPYLTARIKLKDEILYQQGDLATDVWFVFSGEVKLYFDVPSGTIPFTINPAGSMFSDDGCFVDQIHRSTALVTKNAHLLSVSKQAFRSVLD